HVAWIAAEMDSTNRARLRRENRTNRIDGDVLRVTIDISKDWDRSKQCNAARGNDKSAAARDDVVPWPNANTAQSQLERKSSICDRNRMLGATGLGKFTLKGSSLLPYRVVPTAAARDFYDLFDLALRRIWPSGKFAGSHGRAAVDSQCWSKSHRRRDHLEAQFGKL